MNKKYSIILISFLAVLAIGFYDVKAGFNPRELLRIFLPTIVRDEANAQSISPKDALYVFFSSTTTNGNAGGRYGMNAICTNTDPASHFCSLDEVENSWATTGVYFNTPTNEIGWIDHPSALGTKHILSDGSTDALDWNRSYYNLGYSCSGWLSTSYPNPSSPPQEGYVIWNGGSWSYHSCIDSIKVTCCKSNP